MADIATVDQLDARGKRVLVRVDFNVPVADGVCSDDTRIRAALPTIEKLIDEGARVILMSHLGRPSGEGFEEKFTLRPAALRLSELLGRPVAFASDTVGPDAQAKAAALQDGQVLVLENLRFDKREKKNDPEFCQELAKLGEAYVNDAFGTAHRAHASTAGVAALLPAYAGYLMQNEVATLTGMLDEPASPLRRHPGRLEGLRQDQGHRRASWTSATPSSSAAACASRSCWRRASRWAPRSRRRIGSSARRPCCAKAEERGVKLLLPVDVVCADKFAEDANTKTVSVDEIPADMMGLDIGPETVEAVRCRPSRRLPPCSGTAPWACSRWRRSRRARRPWPRPWPTTSRRDTIIGGGDSVAAVNKFDLADQHDVHLHGRRRQHGAGAGRGPSRRGGSEALR